MSAIPNDPNCQNKFCLGKRALYLALPQYSSRIDMGLATYNQYFETAAQPPNFRTVCTYDEIALNGTFWGDRRVCSRPTQASLETRRPNSTTITGSTLSCTPTASVASGHTSNYAHTCERYAVGNAMPTTSPPTCWAAPPTARAPP